MIVKDMDHSGMNQLISEIFNGTESEMEQLQIVHTSVLRMLVYGNRTWLKLAQDNSVCHR